MQSFSVALVGVGMIAAIFVVQPVAAGEAPMQITKSYSGLLGVGVHAYIPTICWKTLDAGLHDEPEHRFLIPSTIDGRKVTSTQLTIDFNEDQVGWVAVKLVGPDGKVAHRACFVDSAAIGSFPSGDYSVHVDLAGGPIAAYSFSVTAELRLA